MRRGAIGFTLGALVAACAFPVTVPAGGFICLPACQSGLRCVGGLCVAVDGGSDAGEPADAGVPDAGPPDAGQPDAGPDAGSEDAGPFDAGPPTITSVETEASTSTVAGSNVVRQGAGTIAIDVLGESLGGATSVTVGGNPASLANVSDTDLRVEPFIDHGVPPGDLPLVVKLADGSTVAASGLFSVSYITSSVGGSDASGDGSSAHPFRSLTQALNVASANTAGAGDTVSLLSGTYDAADGEVWPTAQSRLAPVTPGIANRANLPADVTVLGAGQSNTVLSGPGPDAGTDIAEPVAFIPAGSGSLVQGLTIDGFAFGYVTNSGSNALHGVTIQNSSLDGVLVWGNGAQTSLALDGSDVLDGQDNGIFCRHSSLTMDGGALNGNVGAGLILQDDTTASLSGVEIASNATGVYAGSDGPQYSQTFTLDTCHVHENLGPGVQAESKSGSYHTIYVTNSEIDSNDSDGIYLSTDTQDSLTTTAVVVDGGIIASNTDDGILIGAGLWHLTTLDLEGTTLQDNGACGLELGADQIGTGPFDGGASLTLHNVTAVGNAYGVRLEGSPLLADLGAAAGGGVNQLTGNATFQLSDERPAGAAVVVEASGAVLALDGGSWPKGMLQTGPVAQPPVFRIVNPGNEIQF